MIIDTSAVVAVDFRLTDIEIVIEPTRSKRLSEVVASYGVAAP